MYRPVVLLWDRKTADVTFQLTLLKLTYKETTGSSHHHDRYLSYIINNDGYSQKERDHLEDLGADGRIISKWVGDCGLDLFGSRHESVAGSCKHTNEPLYSIKGGKFIEYKRLLACQECFCFMKLAS
jgi:hypothetical protein